LKVLLTGASGIIGRELARQMVENGFDVRALLRASDEAASLEGLDLNRVTGDTLDPESVQEALEGRQAVFHCDQSTAYRPARSAAVVARNVNGTRNLLVAMSRSGVEQLVHVGSAFSFGPGALDKPGTEDNPYDGERFGLACLDSLKVAQDLALRYNESGKLRCIVVNPTLVVGPGGGPDGPFAALFEYATAGNGTYPPGGVNLVTARDAAAAAFRALGRGRPGRCYILGGVNLSYRTLLEKVSSALGLRPPDRIDPDIEVLAGAGAGSFFARFRRKRSLLTGELARLAAAELYYSSERAVRELAFSPGPIEPAIEEACLRWAGG
jgi:dihydroflavonol-4-reductase